MDLPLRQKVLASISRALWGEVFPAIRNVEFAVSSDERSLDIWVVYDGPVPQDDLDALSAAFAEVYADFSWPERGDPVISEHFVRVDAPAPVERRGDLVFQRREPKSAPDRPPGTGWRHVYVVFRVDERPTDSPDPNLWITIKEVLGSEASAAAEVSRLDSLRKGGRGRYLFQCAKARPELAAVMQQLKVDSEDS